MRRIYQTLHITLILILVIFASSSPVYSESDVNLRPNLGCATSQEDEFKERFDEAAGETGFSFGDGPTLILSEEQKQKEQQEQKMIETWLNLFGRNEHGLLDSVTVFRINALEAFRNAVDKLFCKYVNKRDVLLDIGSGAGGGFRLKPDWFKARNWYQLEETLANIQVASEWGLGKKFIHADAHSMPLESARFNVALGLASYDTFERLDGAVRETNRILKPEGIFIHILDVFPNDIALQGENVSELDDGGHAIFETKLVNALKNNGFEILETGDLKGTWSGIMTKRHRYFVNSDYPEAEIPNPERINKISLHYSSGWKPQIIYAENGERPNEKITEEIVVRIVVAKKVNNSLINPNKAVEGKRNIKFYLQKLYRIGI